MFILPTLDAGGAENYALRFIKFIGQDQFTCHVLSLKLSQGDLEPDFLESGCKVHYKSIGYLNYNKGSAFYRFLKTENFDSLITFNGNFGGLPIAIAKMAGVKTRIAWHRRSTNAFGNNKFKLMYNEFVNRLIRTYATQILSNSQFALDNFYKDYWTKDIRFKIIPNGVDASHYQIKESKSEARESLDLPQSKFIIGHVGRFDPAKNHTTIFEVAQKLKAKQPNIYFLFCGKHTDSNEFKSLLVKHGIEDISICLGLSNQLPLVYRSIDLFYFPSLTEGQPNALIEAMCSGVPVLPSNIPPILEALPRYAHQNTVESTDVDASFRYIQELINDSETQRLEHLIYQNHAEDSFDLKHNLKLFLQII